MLTTCSASVNVLCYDRLNKDPRHLRFIIEETPVVTGCSGNLIWKSADCIFYPEQGVNRCWNI